MAEKIITPDQHEITVRKARIWTPAQIVLTIIIIIFSLTCLLPFVNVAAVSLSSKSAILRGDVSFWPVEFETTAYQAIFSDKSMIRSLLFTVIITVVYTAFSMLMTILMAYPLTKKRLRGRNRLPRRRDRLLDAPRPDRPLDPVDPDSRLRARARADVLLPLRL